MQVSKHRLLIIMKGCEMAKTKTRYYNSSHNNNDHLCEDPEATNADETKF